MNRLEIRENFRTENPELTDRVISDAILNDWCKIADKEICGYTRCIVSNEPEEITSVADIQFYDLETNITRFYDIDDFPGGGVYYDDEPLKKASPSTMNHISTTWKGRSSGTPRHYWRRGKYLWFDYPCYDAQTIMVDVVYKSEDFDDDAKTPYNQLGYLEPFHPGILKYLQMRAKQKIGKDPARAEKDYNNYRDSMKKEVRSYGHGKAFMRIKSTS